MTWTIYDIHCKTAEYYQTNEKCDKFMVSGPLPLQKKKKGNPKGEKFSHSPKEKSEIFFLINSSN